MNGIIYLHDSNNNARIHLLDRLKHFKLILGDEIAKKILVVTTKYLDIKLSN